MDFDPVVHSYHQAIGTGVMPMLADVREPEALIERLRTEAQIDFYRPVALLAGGVFHFVTDQENPAGIIARFGEVMAVGSYVVFTHLSGRVDRKLRGCMKAQTIGSASEFVFRLPEELATWLDGFEQLDPGVATVQDWLSGDLPPTRLVLLGAIGRKPSPEDEVDRGRTR